jgi:putative transposase
MLEKAQIAIFMDGKGAWRDNVFVERLWRSIKYEEAYLHAYKIVSEARAGIGRYLTFYIPDADIHPLTVRRPIRPTSIR